MADRFDLKGSTILVTGAGSGIGAAIARRLADSGATLVINDLLEERASAVCDEITAAGGEAVPVVGDISRRESAREVTAQAIAALGGLTGLVNNAGIVRGGALADLSEAAWRETFAVDLDSAFYCCQAALPALRESRGAIVNTSSLVAVAAAPGGGAYSAAKAALVSFTQQAALEWGPDGIRVNAVGPGLIGGTRFSPQSGDAELQARRGAAVPLRRTGTAEDVAPVVTFLLSDAARYVTGQLLLIDGGFGIALQTLLPS